MPEILKEWAGYNGKMTEEKKPDGSLKKTKHHKIWAVALTDTGHVYVRYGPAKHPLKLTEQIIRPKRDCSEMEALSEAEQLFQEKVREKLNQKGYDAISFETPPHYVPSFSKWRMSDEPEEIIVPVHEVATVPHEARVKPLLHVLNEVSQLVLESPCSRCHRQHPRYLVDIGNGQPYVPAMVRSLLEQTAEGQAWLYAPCTRHENTLLHAETQELLAVLIDTETLPECVFKEGAVKDFLGEQDSRDHVQ